VTDERGQFALTSLDPELLFRLLAVADGHIPTPTPKLIDPKSGPVLLKLKTHDLDRREPALVFRGRILDETGNPAPEALVEPFGFGKGDGAQFGGLEGFNALALTNSKGEFRLGLPKKGLDLYLQVSARGFTTRNFRKLPADRVQDLRLDRGVTVTGRVVKAFQPLPGVAVGLAQRDRNAETFVGDYKAATDKQGVFTIVNVPANDGFVLYGLMDSCKAHGAIAALPFDTRASGTTVKIGDLEIAPGYRLSGKLVLAESKAVPAGTRVIVSREEAWDSQQALVGQDGSFLFTGLPAERYSLSANVRGYRPSARNASLDPLNSFRLLGSVHADIAGLRLLYEPGSLQRPVNTGQKEFEEYQRRRDAPLRGAPAE
jgi:hypothetical protein